MKKVAILGLLMLAGCATSPITSTDAAQVPNERVYTNQVQTETNAIPVKITRDTGMNGKGCTIAVSVDREKAVDIKTGETTTIWLVPGQHMVAAENRALFCGMGPVETLIDTERTKALRVSIERGSRLHIGPTAY